VSVRSGSRASMPGMMDTVLNLGLNDGTYMPEACTQVLRDFAHTLGLRNYSTSDNRPLCEAIARVDGCKAENVFLHNGSGPILKQVVPSIIRSQIKSSPLRVARHLLWKTGFPTVAGSLTYGKVPVKAMELGLRVEMDLRNEKINYKVREHSLAKVPFILVAGRKEAEDGTLSVRRLGSEKSEIMKVEDVIALMQKEAVPPDLVPAAQA
jgi:hypothetical protein